MSENPAQMIALNLIRDNEHALRGVNIDSEEFKGVKESIRKNGQFQNVTVMQKIDPNTNEQFYLLIDGLQRTTAFRQLNAEDPNDPRFQKIEAKVLPDNDDEIEVMTIQLSANIANVKTKPTEIAKQLKRMLVIHPQWTLENLSKQVSKSVAWVMGMLTLNGLSSDITEMLDSGVLPVSNALNIAKLPEDQRSDFIDRARTMPSNEFASLITNRMSEIKKAAREGREVKPEEFVPIPKFRSLREVLDDGIFEKFIMSISGMGLPESEIAKKTREWIVSLDEATVSSKRADYEAKKAKKIADKEARQKAKLEKMGIDPSQVRVDN